MALADWAVYRLSDGYIDNVIWFDADTSQYTPPEDHGMVEIPGNDGLAGEWSMCGIGWSYINGQFIEPKNPNAITSLAANVLATDTVLPAENTSTFFDSGYLLVDKEWVSYSGLNGNTFTGVVRGLNGTIAVDHVTGEKVSYSAELIVQPASTGAQTL